MVLLYGSYLGIALILLFSGRNAFPEERGKNLGAATESRSSRCVFRNGGAVKGLSQCCGL